VKQIYVKNYLSLICYFNGRVSTKEFVT